MRTTIYRIAVSLEKFLFDSEPRTWVVNLLAKGYQRYVQEKLLEWIPVSMRKS